MNTKRLLYIIIFLLFLNLLVLISIFNFRSTKSTKSGRDFSDIKKENVLNIVTQFDSIDFQLKSDYSARFQYEFCQYISMRSGLIIQNYFENDLDIAVRKLENYEYDVIAQNISINNENREFLAFTVPIGQTRQVLVQRKKNELDSVLFISNQLELANQTIYVYKNPAAVLRLNNLSEEIAEPINVKELFVNSFEQLIRMLVKREIDYLVTDIDNAQKQSELFPDLDYSTNISFTQLQAWALRKSSPVLLDSLNLWIKDFKESGYIKSK